MFHPAVTAHLGAANYAVRLEARTHMFAADEPSAVGGGDTAAEPGELLAGALASCTAITIKMYAERKEWPLASVTVAVASAKSGDSRSYRCEIRLDGNLTDEQRHRLIDIASRCPVHKTLEAGARIKDVLAD